jgi:hypothetical protein
MLELLIELVRQPLDPKIIRVILIGAYPCQSLRPRKAIKVISKAFAEPVGAELCSPWKSNAGE